MLNIQHRNQSCRDSGVANFEICQKCSEIVFIMCTIYSSKISVCGLFFFDRLV